MIALRPYQQAVIDGALNAWRTYRRIAAVMATGAGKTVVFSHLAGLALAAGPVLVIAHRTELIDQATDKLRQVNPQSRVGVFKAAVKQYRADVVVASVQTASTQKGMSLLRSRRWALVIIDEVHHGVADTYLRVCQELRVYEPDGPLLLGVTATLDRADGRALGELIQHIVQPTVGLIDLIRHPEGPYLVPPRGIRVRIDELDLRAVRRTAGDYNSGALGAAMSSAMAPQRIVDAWTEHAEGRSTVAFAPTVAFSVELAQAFRDAGHEAVHLDGTTAAKERAAHLDRFRDGELIILSNVGLFTEGTDLPSIGCVILGRPTSSTTLYQQMVGRGLRLHPGKRDCVILDVTGVTGRHRLATLASLNGADSPEDMPDDLLMYEEDLTSEDAPAEADIPVDSPADTEPEQYADGKLEHELIDLFGQAHSAWLRTDGGIWFVPVTHGFVYLRPRPHDRYDLAYYATAQPRQGRQASHGVIREDMEIGYAMAAGDEYVSSVPMWQTDRNAKWRSGARGEHFDRKRRVEATAALDRLL